jgi:hypothetical protein
MARRLRYDLKFCSRTQYQLIRNYRPEPLSSPDIVPELTMRTSPSISPAQPDDRDVYLVLDDFGERLGRAWRETDEESADRHAVITDLMDGHIATQRGSLPSIPRKAGRATCRPSSPT